MTEQMLAVGGVTICAETFGNAEDPAILLLAGMSCSMDWWEVAWCERLAAAGRHVVRYDFRDTGRSTSYPPGEPGYTGADLRDDVVGILDALGIARAHLVGLSMGGGIAQCVAVEHPERVTALTLVATGAALGGAPDGPPPAPELLAYFERAGERPAPDWRDRDAVTAMLVEDQRAFARGGFDEERVREVVARVLDRTPDIRSSLTNHGNLDDGRPVVGTLADIRVPTLVVHGTADPMFPVEHAEILASAIPDATVLTLDGVGHEAPPPSTWDVVVPAVVGVGAA